MADLKISALPAASVALAGTEVLPIVQSSATKQVTVANLTAGRAVATGALTVTGDATLSTGNLVISTSGQGIDFSATPGTGTSELLSDYEEGTWTPTDGSGAGLTITVNDAYYTKVGRVVNFYLDVTYPSTANGNQASLSSLPFAPSKDGGGSLGFQTIAFLTQLFVNVFASGPTVRILKNTSGPLVNSELSTHRFQITGQYIV